MTYQPNRNNVILHQCEQDKKMPQLQLSGEKERDCIIEDQNKNAKQMKLTAVVSPIMQSIKRASKATQLAMMTPRSRAPIILNFPMQYLETDL
ncbi:hypothetical protein CHS0354_033511 [Potamilus streckersoni]|uniref:Uncharacterized protein n=1 Tax=Potamilus streckersoni TaxID=2493646 RepID=A0AAE0SAY4_9BIVA|nr:hypothetical protein CHS0354_033511 [Potamilus streckersoni]